jgi:hypothetical protein
LDDLEQGFRGNHVFGVTLVKYYANSLQNLKNEPKIIQIGQLLAIAE